ncbi:hypothetical protein MP969_25875 [Escherichia coli]|nr:hypothetical protein [Escherichia coli]MCI3325444.1 hypothetical protein [Escherichia coli]
MIDQVVVVVPGDEMMMVVGPEEEHATNVERRDTLLVNAQSPADLIDLEATSNVGEEMTTKIRTMSSMAVQELKITPGMWYRSICQGPLLTQALWSRHKSFNKKSLIS